MQGMNNLNLKAQNKNKHFYDNIFL